jgi:tRNA 5-methylaminomethyl-2-thiouridine biosynthesis bifunctional protein
VRSQGGLASLRVVIFHEGYLPPARLGEHCLGATFNIEEDTRGGMEQRDSEPRAADHEANLAQLARALPALTEDLPLAAAGRLTGRVGYRCASPDYLPVVGPVPDAARFCDDYGTLRRNAKRAILKTASHLPGLYLSTGHGSRGLTSTPLSGELLAAQICGETWPLPADLVRALAPARFLVRDLVKNRR